MTDIAELMQRRMHLVEKLASLNSKQLLNTQARSGAEVELLACIEEIEAKGENEAALARHADLEARYKAAIAVCEDCERELDELAERMNALDNEISQAQ
jgi:DNA repair exonuclease SbcCD ATPase subunit